MEIVIWVCFSVFWLIVAIMTEFYECILLQKAIIKQYELKLLNYEKEYKNVLWGNVKGQNFWKS